jgi:hypothetical protein
MVAPDACCFLVFTLAAESARWTATNALAHVFRSSVADAQRVALRDGKARYSGTYQAQPHARFRHAIPGAAVLMRRRSGRDECRPQFEPTYA